jgi:hypothetical protein
MKQQIRKLVMQLGGQSDPTGRICYLGGERRCSSYFSVSSCLGGYRYKTNTTKTRRHEDLCLWLLHFVGPGRIEDFPGDVFFVVVSINADKNSAAFNGVVEELGFMFRNSKTDQRASQTSGSGTGA